MDGNQAMFTQTVDRHVLPPHIHEFLSVSATYLGVDIDSLGRETLL
ncbi:MAG: hypothetical protein P8Y24_02340 [Gammaproteobacteria bacterium]|jgi:hypothetical protein